MKPYKKIKAFTLGELIIVMILTSVIVALAFTVLNLVQGRLQNIQGNFTKSDEFNKLKNALTIDMSRYPKAEYFILDNSLLFSSEIDSMFYQFHDDYIVRSIDTFDLKINTKTFYFNGLKVNTSKVDAIELATKEGINKEMFIFKRNDAKAFMD